MPPCGTAQRKSGGAARQHHTRGLQATAPRTHCTSSRCDVSRPRNDAELRRLARIATAVLPSIPSRTPLLPRSFRREVTRINSDRPRRGPSRTAASVARAMKKAKKAQKTSCVRTCVGKDWELEEETEGCPGSKLSTLDIRKKERDSAAKAREIARQSVRSERSRRMCVHARWHHRSTYMQRTHVVTRRATFAPSFGA
ncbi:hypothetical protein MRX96_012362 [Rhipicephalus microplus]